MSKKTTEQFVAEAVEKHGDRYSYDDVEYVNAHTCVSIKCELHDEFQQTPSSHLKGRGCPYCSGHKFKIEDSLEYRFPDIAKELHPENEKTAKEIYCFSHFKTLWICDQNHIWHSEALRTGDYLDILNI